MIVVRRNVDEFLCLLLNGAYHVWVAVAGGVDGNAGHEVQEAVAVDIEDFTATAVGHDKIGNTAIGVGHHTLVAASRSRALGPGTFRRVMVLVNMISSFFLFFVASALDASYFRASGRSPGPVAELARDLARRHLDKRGDGRIRVRRQAQARPANADGRHDLPFAVVDRSGNRHKPWLEFLDGQGVALLADLLKLATQP